MTSLSFQEPNAEGTLQNYSMQTLGSKIILQSNNYVENIFS